jgi:hypothetical protein
MPRSTAFVPFVLAAALAAAGCSSDTPTTPGDTQTPVSIAETFAESLNPNGGRTHPFIVERAGEVSAVLSSVTPHTEINTETGIETEVATVLGLSIGTWNGQVCQIILANDNATIGVTVTGSATAIGSFCVRVYDVGKLKKNVEYSVTITHY